MAKFPTDVECSVTVRAPIDRVYAYLWDVVGSSDNIPGLASCKKVGSDTYRFVFEPRSTGPITVVVRYTAKYESNRTDRIHYVGINASGDTTDIDGSLRLAGLAGEKTKITLKQTVAPETPVPRLLQGLLRSFVTQEATDSSKRYLANVKQALEGD